MRGLVFAVLMTVTACAETTQAIDDVARRTRTPARTIMAANGITSRELLAHEYLIIPLDCEPFCH